MSNAADPPLILPSDNLSQQESSLAGLKAARLGELGQAGFKVPAGFVLTTFAFELLIAENGLTAESSPETVLAATFPAQVESALEAALVGFENIPLAVRSSAVAEDRPEASFAGQYETILNVRGFKEVVQAVLQCWASAFRPRLAAYRQRQGVNFGSMAVLVQRMIPARVAGVAFTANPTNGNRSETLVQAVEGLGDRLVNGQVTPDEWIIRQGEVVYQVAPGKTLTAKEALNVVEVARRVETLYGTPQDLEWAIAGEELYLLQARPVTALPPQVEWKAPLPGAWTRNFRLGEWLPDPVTPLFESWLLERLEERLSYYHRTEGGVPIPAPAHLIINGWYYFSANFFPDRTSKMPGFMLRNMLPVILRHPWRMFLQVAMLQTSRFGVEPFVRDWREKNWPRYRQLVLDEEDRVDQLEPAGLTRLIDHVGEAAGNYLWSLIIVGGFAWKAESPLAEFYQSQLYPRLGGSYQLLLGGLYIPQTEISQGAVYSLDWVQPTYQEYKPALAFIADLAERQKTLKERRVDLEQQARAYLAGNTARLKRFNRLLEVAQRYAPIREEVVANFTFGWPLLRRAVLNLGRYLEKLNCLKDPADIFFLRREEVEEVVKDVNKRSDLTELAQTRRKEWQQQRRLTPPLLIGKVPKMMRPMLSDLENFRSGPLQAGAILKGLPASPGQATGRVRIINDPAEFDRLEEGEILVTAATTPGWTTLFSRAAAVVTNVGSPVAHTSLVAREYGLPVVVGTEDATKRLRNGQVVTVDGSAGVVILDDTIKVSSK